MKTLYGILGVLTSIGFINMLIKFIDNVNRSRESEYSSDIVALVLLGGVTFLFFYLAFKPKKIKVDKQKDTNEYKDYNLIKKVFSKVKGTKEKISDLSLLSNKSWIKTTSTDTREVWIFKKDNTLIISKNGIVEIGKWEYFNESKSILIVLSNENKLFSQVIVGGSSLTIELDGAGEIISFEDEALIASVIPEITNSNEVISEPIKAEPTEEELIEEQLQVKRDDFKRYIAIFVLLLLLFWVIDYTLVFNQIENAIIISLNVVFLLIQLIIIRLIIQKRKIILRIKKSTKR